jgi:hypothetical protein
MHIHIHIHIHILRQSRQFCNVIPFIYSFCNDIPFPLLLHLDLLCSSRFLPPFPSTPERQWATTNRGLAFVIGGQGGDARVVRLVQKALLEQGTKRTL